jgi:HlyD family secretion protein
MMTALFARFVARALSRLRQRLRRGSPQQNAKVAGSRLRTLQGPRYIVLALSIAAASCARDEKPDAYGNVEAVEVSVSSEAAGRLIRFDVQEGQTLAAAAEVGAIDPSELQLQRNQAEAQHVATTSRIDETGRQRAVVEAQRAAAAAQVEAARAQRSALETQLEIARRNLDRTKRLVDQQAATAQQFDQADRDVRVLEDQVKAQGEQIEAQSKQVMAYEGQLAAITAQQRTAARQADSAGAQVALADDRLRRTRVVNPTAGTVLVTYAEAGEFVQPGQPLYKIADLSSVDVRAYVTEPQLANLRVGQQVQVNVDTGNDQRESMAGSITWIASSAEFTPTPIQTRDERADLVYAVKIRVPNQQGVLKIGMPVDVSLKSRR